MALWTKSVEGAGCHMGTIDIGPNQSSELVGRYFDMLDRLLKGVAVTDRPGAIISGKAGLAKAGEMVRSTTESARMVLIIGNGGSAGIASQVSYDLTYNRHIRALGFSDGCTLTGLSADHGYRDVFTKQVAAHGRPGDQLIAISSSGQSPNILEAVDVAKEGGLGVITMSGFKPDNPLRRAGDLSFYIASNEYGFVEVCHLALCDAIVDHAIASTDATVQRSIEAHPALSC